MGRERIATLVVIDEQGELVGVSDPMGIELPWWQEVGPIVDAVPDVVVLRLLDAEPDEDQPMGGRVTYLVQLAAGTGRRPGSAAGAPLALRPWTGELAPHALRHPWAEPGGPAEDLAWVSSVVEVTGPPRQHRSWNLSAITSIPTARGTVWLKCVPPFFAHEGVVLEAMAGRPVPNLLAAEGHRLLMEQLPGEDGHEAGEPEQVEMIEALVGIQRTAVDLVGGLMDAGVPDLRAGASGTGPLATELTQLVRRLAPDSEPLNQLVKDLPSRLAAVAECGLPDTLVHGDPHGGNCRRGVSPPVWFDWGDSFVGNPILDLAATHRMSPKAVDRWLDLWAAAVPGSDPRRAWDRLKPVAELRMAWVYQRFLDNIEPAEHVYHRDDVPEALRRAERAVTSESANRESGHARPA